MSGVRLYNFREGDRAEYLANYLLSGLGLVTAVERQEDIGYDFYCQIADQEKGTLSFGFPYIVSVKSKSTASIVFGETDNKKWKSNDIDWIKRLEIPLLFGLVDNRTMSIHIYNCSLVRYVFAWSPDPTIIEFVPRKDNRADTLSEPKIEVLKDWPTKGCGDGKKYTVDLGNPIITITNDDIYNNKAAAQKKEILRALIIMEQQNILFGRLVVPHFHWTNIVETDKTFFSKMAYFTAKNHDVLTNHYRSLGPGLISLAINLRENGNETLLKEIIPLLREIPKDIIPTGVMKSNPDLFN